MQVFMSWSGERSRLVAEAIHTWLPLVLQSAKPWFSPADIEKGAQWLADLNAKLEQESIGILCVTRESLGAPWLLFEAGVLSKALEASRVCPLIFDVEPSDLQGPLAQFQATRPTKDDMRRLLGMLNRRVEVSIADHQLDTLHELLWPQLSERFEVIRAHPTAKAAPHRTLPELMEEILTRIRAIERGLAATGSPQGSASFGAPLPMDARSYVAPIDERVKMLRIEIDRARAFLARSESQVNLSASDQDRLEQQESRDIVALQLRTNETELDALLAERRRIEAVARALRTSSGDA